MQYRWGPEEGIVFFWDCSCSRFWAVMWVLKIKPSSFLFFGYIHPPLPTPPKSTLFPLTSLSTQCLFFFFWFFFNYKTNKQKWAQFVLLNCHTVKGNWLSLSQQRLISNANSSQASGGIPCLPPFIHAGLVSGLNLRGYSVCSLSCSELICGTAWLCLENTVSLKLFTISGSQQPFGPIFREDPWAFGGRVWYVFRVECSTVSGFLCQWPSTTRRNFSVKGWEMLWFVGAAISH